MAPGVAKMLLPEELGFRLSVAEAGRNSLPDSLVGIIQEVGFLQAAIVCASDLTEEAACVAALDAPLLEPAGALENGIDI